MYLIKFKIHTINVLWHILLQEALFFRTLRRNFEDMLHLSDLLMYVQLFELLRLLS